VPVLVDGNNLLYAARAAEDPTRLFGRSMLCDALGAWAARQGERVRVVFDGPAPKEPLAEQIGHPAIEVFYSERESADEVLARHVVASTAGRLLWVVSTDREVARQAKRCRATPITSEAFWSLVRRERSRPPVRRSEPAAKEHGLDPVEADAWMRDLGLDEPDAMDRSGQ